MKAKVGDLELQYDTFGDRASKPLLLIMGLGAQMTTWPEGLCEELAARGFFVARFDNRDIGLSTYLDELGPPDFAAPAYTLDDMAADAVGVLDHLGVEKAHVVGASMGGMIAQLVAINHADRVLSLTSIMSNVGGGDSVQPADGSLGAIFAPPPPDREGRIESSVVLRRILAGGNPIDEARERELAAAQIDRAWHPEGTMRQAAAIVSAGSRRDALGRLQVPALVIHGQDDPLVPPENGRRTAGAIPGARLLEFEGMGHNLPPQTWPRIADAIADLAARTEAPQATA